MNSRCHRKQKGVAALLFLFVLLVGVAGWLVSGLSSARLEIDRDKRTAEALARAKEALVGRAAKDSVRPGSLSCPDIDGDGDAESPVAYGGVCPSYLGRLPWKTLGLPDIRDAYGEGLWYAVSANFRDHQSGGALNSDTNGQLTVTGTSPASNVIAIIFAAGPALTSQVRDPASENAVTNYLEGENTNVPPNSNYVTGMASAAFNDRLLTIVADELFAVVEKRVVREVQNALTDYYTILADGSPNPAGVLPHPARFDDVQCLGAAPISSGCNSDSSSDRGRIPANGVMWSTGGGSSTFLQGDPPSWFQTNGWREVVYYAAAPACTSPANPSCGGTGGFLTLNVPPGPPLVTQKVVVIAAGKAIGSQARSTNPQKRTESNYVELENANADNTYVKDVVSVNFNDRAVNIP